MFVLGDYPYDQRHNPFVLIRKADVGQFFASVKFGESAEYLFEVFVELFTGFGRYQRADQLSGVRGPVEVFDVVIPHRFQDKFFV